MKKFSKTFSPDAYFGYGFKDHRWKYGAGLDMKLSDKRTSVFRIDYYDDVFPAGRIKYYILDNPMKLKGHPCRYAQRQFLPEPEMGASFLYDLSNTLSAKISVNHENQNAQFDYQYQNMGNNFKNVSTTLSLEICNPNDKNLMTPGGKLTYEKHYPYFFVNYEKEVKYSTETLIITDWMSLAIHQFELN